MKIDPEPGWDAGGGFHGDVTVIVFTVLDATMRLLP
jgi:hypothetical protein